jgi:hypothetical protein
LLPDDFDDKPRPEVVQFYMKPVVDQEATLKEGRTVHKEAIYIRITLPADKNLEVDRPIYVEGQKEEYDAKRYPRHWLAFQANKSQESLSGTLLSSWGHLSPALVEDYRVQKVLTVEQLATIADAHIHKLGSGAIGHRQAALDFIEASKGRAPLLRLQRETDDLRAQLAAMQAQLAGGHAAAAPVAAVEAAAAPAAQFDAVTGLPLPGTAHAPAEYVPPPRKRTRGRPAKHAKEAQ